MTQQDNQTPFTKRLAGEAFLIDPGSEPGPGVLVLHSWWGLTDWTKEFCGTVAKAGFTALAPDLLGELPDSPERAETVLAESDPDQLAGLVMSSAQTLRAATKDAEQKIAVIGFGMGASLAYWLAVRLPLNVSAAVGFYGSQAIDFDDASAKFMGHFATDDDLVSEDERVSMESFMRLGGCDTEFYTYPDTKHGFFESGPSFDQKSHDLAWQRTKDLLTSQLHSS